MSPTSREVPATLHSVLLCLVIAASAPGQTSSPSSAPSDPETYERMLREEKTRHVDVVRRLADEEDRLRTALDAARARLAEADARRASLQKLLAEASREADELRSRLDGARTVLKSVEARLAATAQRLAARLPLPPEVLREGASLARRIRLVFQILDRELVAARGVSVAPRERMGALGYEVRLGSIARFFVPAAGGPAVLEPSGRELPGPIGEALREVIRQTSKKARGTLVRIPWWGDS